jgi:hypothetical protein
LNGTGIATLLMGNDAHEPYFGNRHMKTTKYVNKAVKAIVPLSIVAGILALVSPAASATLVMASGFNENDCSGFFGQGFDNCDVNGSPVIAKFEGNPLIVDEDEDIGEINNTDFPSIDGTEWSFVGGEGDAAGSWIYTPTPGQDDPEIMYWVAKGGMGGDFKLFWEVDTDVGMGSGFTCDTTDAMSAYTPACLNEALVQTSGIWETPTGQSLSHLTFYDTGGGGGGSAPEPGVLVLLATGLLGIGLVRRRGRQA